MTKARPLKLPTGSEKKSRLAIELWREHQPAMLSDRLRAHSISEDELKLILEHLAGDAKRTRRPTRRSETWASRLGIAESIAMLEGRGVQRKRAIQAVSKVFGVSKRHVENVIADFSK